MLKIVKKVVKRVFVVIGISIILIIGIGVVFLYTSPQFGGVISEKKKENYSESKQYRDGKFINNNNVKIEMSFGDMMKAIGGMFTSNSNTKPEKNIEVERVDSLNIVNYDSKIKTRLIWFGHSSFLMQIHDKNILIDPMFGSVPAPNSLLGTKRFSKELPIEVEKLPFIDAVLISHDHYDHLDYGSIQKLKNKVGVFYTPLGVGAHLIEWGVDEDKIIELDWWQDSKFEDITFRCTPAQHFSGRGISDSDRTLWCSWVISTDNTNVFFSGDSGYANHFKEIGDKFGPFDIAMIECGQYNELWPDVHMYPEESAQAGADVQAKKIMAIHWGAFKLSQHSWIDPIERISAKSLELNIELITPKIGQPVIVSEQGDYSKWWLN